MSGRQSVPKVTRRRTPKRRQNPAVAGVRRATIYGQRATLVAVGLEAITYHHAQSATRALYTHDFDGDEQLWALADGALVIRHPRRRLWSDFLVGDAE